MTRLSGKTAVITGGATGIGRAAAKRFIDEGAFVFIFGRRQEALDAAVSTSEFHPFAKPGHQRFVGWTRRFELGCPLRQCVPFRTQ